MKFFYKLGIFSLGTIVTLFSSPVRWEKFGQPYLSPEMAVAEMSEQQLAAKVKEITTIINGQNPGSGVIIGRENNTYYVLTAKHAIATEDEYEIITADGMAYSLNYNTVRKLPNVDLALVQFSSNQSYPVATIGNSDNATEGTTIYISGWPHPGQAITERLFQFTSGKISGRSLASAQDGYELVYTNITRAGMSGGPVFNQDGELIAIHGRAEGQEIFNPDTGDTVDIKSGFNLGIPILYFLDLSSSTELGRNQTVVPPLLQWADRLLRENQLSMALDAYEKALAIRPEVVPAMTNVGLIQYELGEMDSAIAQWKTVEELDSNNAEVQMAIAVALYKKGEQETALHYATKAIQLDSEIANRQLLKRYLWGDRLLADAQPILDYTAKVVSVAAQELAVEFNVGQAQYEAGNLERAKAFFEEAIEHDREASDWENRVSASVALATTLYAQGNRDRAIQFMGDFLRASPENRSSWVSRERYFWSDRLKADAEKLLAFFTPRMIVKNNFGSGQVVFSPDGRTIAGGEKIKLWDSQTGEELRTISESRSVQVMAWSPDAKILATNHGESNVNLWDAKSGENIAEFNRSDRDKQNTMLTSLAFSPDGSILASGHDGHSNNLDCIILWDMNTGQILRTFTGHPGVRSIAWSPDGQFLASGSWNHTIKLWNANTGEEQHELIGHSDKIESVTFSPTGKFLASGSWDNTIKLWNVSTGEKQHELTGHQGKVYAVAFSPNGEMIASGSQDETIRFWNSRSGEEFPYLFKANGIVQSLAFSPDGASLVNSSYQNAIEVWQMPGD